MTDQPHVDYAAEWEVHDCDEAGCMERVEAEYQAMLAKMTPEQRAEWDRCCAIFAEKFGPPIA